MNKRKLILLATSLCMVAILAAGGTLAYFMDTDAATNVFTIGHIDIELDEDFGNDVTDENGDPVKDKELMPGKDVKKIVNVNNIGANPAYVRVHIAIPSLLDSGSEDQPQYAAYNNTLHFNFTGDSVADGEWNWGTSIGAAQYPGNGGAWNMYQDTLTDGILYNIYVVTYETALAPETGTTATPAINKVYMDTGVTQQMWDEIQKVLGDEDVKIWVAVEGVQVDTFTDAFNALNTAFGIPGTYEVNWEDVTYDPSAKP